MHFLVLDEVFIVAESFLAFGTAVGLFYGMDRLVSNQVGGPAKTLDAFVPCTTVSREDARGLLLLETM